MKKRHYFLSLKCHEGWQAILYRIFMIPSFLRRKTRTRTPKKKKNPYPFRLRTKLLKKILLRSFSVPRFQKTTRTCSVPVLKFQNQPVYVPFPYPISEIHPHPFPFPYLILKIDPYPFPFPLPKLVRERNGYGFRSRTSDSGAAASFVPKP